MIPRALHVVNEGLAFLLELGALFALGRWGFHTGSGVVVHVLLGLGAPLLAAVAWGLFAAPKARVVVPLAGVLIVKFLVFGAATAGLYAVGRHGIAIAFGAVAAVNMVIATLDRRALMHQRWTTTTP
ncbi:hypothetical protein GCM10010193_50990 [Kitasatospora atroaurantiaca]|uniref:Uncharacterized protein DUF2568 n=1 Tax=Kitasatospora atroaurantiaca TaxID=285545 RepID=A0A561EY39_9ACTN|nr:YrdB family protein [Kitasatospora atroaurantiaca]TWE20526.1 uncharacterized protein DUF2568 [Kitasatospora atroaurantiaca]